LNVGESRADPARVKGLIGPSQCLPGTLDRKLKFVEELRNMGGMIGDRTLFLNHAAYHGAGPDTGRESIGHGATVEDVDQLLPLAWGKVGRTTGPVAFQ
jgi:hypothetical protein